MITAAEPRAPQTGAPGGRARLGRKVAPGALLVGVAVVVALLVVGVRYAIRPDAKPRRVVTANHPAPPAPASSEIESTWGIRFTAIDLLADTGVLELRYQVVVPSKAGRIHDPKVNNLPSILVENTGAKVTPTSAMLHFHHGNTTADGRTYSLIYGNAAGNVHIGDQVSIEMVDHLKLQHIVVTN